MTLQKMPEKKLYDIDFIRALCCILVIVVHVTASFWSVSSETSITFKVIVALNTLSRFAVPSFLFISGFTLFYSYAPQHFSLGAFYHKRLSKVFAPYFLWSAFYTVLNYSSYVAPTGGISWRMFLKELTLGFSSYHLYFMLIILQLYLIFPALLWIYKRINQPLVAFLFFAAVNLFFVIFTDLPLRDRMFPYYLLYFTAAFSFADLRLKGYAFSKVFYWVISLAYFTALFYYGIDNYRVALGVPQVSWRLFIYIFRIYGVIGSIGLYLLAEGLQQSRLKGWLRHPIISSLSRNSFTIYLVHPFFMMVYHWFELRLFPGLLPLLPAFLLKLFSILAGSWIFCLIFEKLKKHY